MRRGKPRLYPRSTLYLAATSRVSTQSTLYLAAERSAAATRLLRIGIDEVEALLHQRVFPIQDHAVQVDERLGIHKDAHVGKLENAVAFARMRVEADVVGQS